MALAAVSPISRATQTRQLRYGHAEIAASWERALDSIYSRYGKDFTQVADEIDLTTGRITVNNGHIDRMRHERDIAPSVPLLQSSQFSDGVDTADDCDDDASEPERLAREDLPSLWQALLQDDRAISPAVDALSPSRIPDLVDRYLSDGDDDGDQSDSHDDESDRARAHFRRRRRHKRPRATKYPSNHRDYSRLALSLRSEPSEGSVEVNADYIELLARRMATAMEQYMKQQTGGLGSRIFLPCTAEDFPLPSVPQMLEGNTSSLARSPPPMSGSSLWSSRDNLGYFNESRKRKRVGTLVEPIPIDPALHSAGSDGEADDERVSLPRPTLPTVEDMHADADAAFRLLAFGIAAPVRPSRESSQSDADMEGPASGRSHRSRKHFSAEEDRLIKHLKETEKRPWKEIEPLFPGRTVRSLQTRWARVLAHVDLPPPRVMAQIKREIIEIDSDDERAILNGTAPITSSQAFVPNDRAHPLGGPTWPQASHPGYHAHPQTHAPHGAMFVLTHPAPQPTGHEILMATGAPRYRRFDSSAGTGSFGILRATGRRADAPPPPDIIAPTIGSCGVIRPTRKAKRQTFKRRRAHGRAQAHDPTTFVNLAPSFMKHMPTYSQALPASTPKVWRAPTQPSPDQNNDDFTHLGPQSQPSAGTDARSSGLDIRSGPSTSDGPTVSRAQCGPSNGHRERIVDLDGVSGVSEGQHGPADQSGAHGQGPTISERIQTSTVGGTTRERDSMNASGTTMDHLATVSPLVIDSRAPDERARIARNAWLDTQPTEPSHTGSEARTMASHTTTGPGAASRQTESIRPKKRFVRYLAPNPDSECDELA